MHLEIDEAVLNDAVNKIMRQQGYVPENDVIGRTISIKDFAKKYCYPHGMIG